MRCLRFIATVAFAGSACADVYTFTDFPLTKSTSTGLRQIYVDASQGPAKINIDNFTASMDKGTLSGVAIALTPVAFDTASDFECLFIQDQVSTVIVPMCRFNCDQVQMAEFLKNGTVISSEFWITTSGVYTLRLFSCGAGVSTFIISGDGLGAHEKGLSTFYAGLTLIYSIVCIAWVSIRQDWAEISRTWPIQEVTAASWNSLAMACAGFIYHAFPEKEAAITKHAFALISAYAVSSLMTALMATAASNYKLNQTKLTLAFSIFFLADLWVVLDYGFEYDLVCDADECLDKGRVRTSLVVFLLCTAIFFTVCGVCLVRSLRMLKDKGVESDVVIAQRLAFVVTVYTALGLISLLARCSDVPSGSPGSWVFHGLAGTAIHQFTQMFGVFSTMLVFWLMGRNAMELESRTVKKEKYQYLGPDKSYTVGSEHLV